MARAMKDSGIEWIGEIPAGWEVRKLKHYYEIQTGFTPDTKKEEFYDDENGFDWVNISDIQDGKIIFNTKKKVSQLFVDQYKPTIIPKGSLLYSFKLSVGQTAFTGKDMYSNEAIAAFLPVKGANLRFLRYSSSLIIENAEVNIYNARILNRDRINNAYIVFPPEAEQNRIADYLDAECARIDAVIEQTRASIEEYKRLKQAIITQAVTKGIHPGRKMKMTGNPWIPEIPVEWNLSRVGLHFDIILGKMLCSSQIAGDYTLEPYYCAANVHFDGVADDDIKQMWFSPVEKAQYLVKLGDLLVVEGGAGAGGCAIVNEIDQPIYVQNSIMIVRKKSKANNRYLRYLIEGFVKSGYIDVVCNKATIPHFTKDKLANVPFVVSQEQEEIADYLDRKTSEIDGLIAKKNQLIIQLESYKKSLIFEYVTGKKEVI